MNAEAIDRVRGAVMEAGEAIRAVRERGFDVRHKGAAGPVTEADLAADAILRRELPRIIPAGWLSEETADAPDRLDQERVWVVDPLDGTKEFVEGVPQYVVAVALVEQGRPVFGMVHNPENRATYWAAAGGGAYCDGRRISVREGSTIAASRSETRRGEFSGFEEAWRIEAIGSIEYKLALVAAGEAAVTLSRGPKHEWDVCAGAILVEEAGGVVTDAYGKPFRFNNDFPKVAGVIAGAPDAYRRAFAEIERMGMSDRMSELSGSEGETSAGAS